ncbi:MAG TPA: hypothetical protein VID19_05655 [Candidatus Eremiobacteraceae bacterium]|jgi:hypothetical protein
MLPEIVVAALLAATPAPTTATVSTPAAAQTAAPAALPATPLREVVYKVSTSERIDDITESYGGGANAVPPSSTLVDEAHGTITVDVMAKFEDGVLGIKVSELWKNSPLPLHFTGAVTADGTVQFASATIDSATIELLPYLATSFAPQGAIVVGTHWSVDKVVGKATVSTDYIVTAAGSDGVTIHKDTKISALGTESVTGTIVYDPSLLVATSGQIRVRRTDMFANGQTMHTIDIGFERISDSFASAAKP